MQPIVMPAVTAFSTFSTRISRSIGTPHFITSPRRVNPFTFAAARAIVGRGQGPASSSERTSPYASLRALRAGQAAVGRGSGAGASAYGRGARADGGQR